MSLVAIGAPIPFWKMFGKTSSTSSATMSAAGDKYAQVFAAPKTGTIDRVRIRTGVVTTGATVDVRLESVTASTGDPSGSLAAANTNASWVIANTDDNVWVEIPLTAGYAATQGEILAIVVVNPGVSFANMVFPRGPSVDSPAFGFSDFFTAAAWNKAQNLGYMGVRYNDGLYAHIPSLVSELPAGASFNSTTNSAGGGDERGNKITIPIACTVYGFWIEPATAKAAQDIVLYDANDNVLLTKAFDADLTVNSSGGDVLVPFASTVDLVAGQVVRIVQKPGASNVTNWTVTVAAGLGTTFPGGTACVYTRRTDAGAWTDTSDKVSMIGLLLSRLDDGARSAGIIQPGQVAAAAARL